MSSIRGLARRVIPCGVALFFFTPWQNHHSPWKTEFVKPQEFEDRVLNSRKAAYSSMIVSSGNPLRLRIDSVPLTKIVYESCAILSQMASARVGSLIFVCHPSTSNCEQNTVDARLYLASIISSKSRDSVSANLTSSHSSRINSCTCLYCLITLRYVPSPLANASSPSSRVNGYILR